MVRLFNSRTNSIYYWLYRRWHQKQREGEPCYFTKGDICAFLGLSDHSRNRKEVEKCLALLAAVGLIQYQVVRKGQTFIRRLTYIGAEIKVLDAVSKAAEEAETIVDGKNEKVVMTVGYDFSDKKKEITNSIVGFLNSTQFD